MSDQNTPTVAEMLDWIHVEIAEGKQYLPCKMLSAIRDHLTRSHAGAGMNAIRQGENDGAGGMGTDRPDICSESVFLADSVGYRSIGDSRLSALVKLIDDNILMDEGETREFISDYAVGKLRDALQSRTEEARTVGWQLVPKEPTDPMLDAGLDHPLVGEPSFWESVYKAMLAAAPEPPKTE